jgi:molybdopterin-binding protein
MKISARNQLKGTVKAVKSGAVMAEVTVEVKPGSVTAAITDTSRNELNIKEGDEVSVIVKATEVMIATP